MIMKKRHAYNLAILLAAGSIMISACGKKTDEDFIKKPESALRFRALLAIMQTMQNVKKPS